MKWGGGLRQVCTAIFWLANPDDFSATSQRLFSPNLATIREPMSHRRFSKRISKIFRLGVICPQKPRNWRGQTGTLLWSAYSPQDALQRFCSLHVVVQRPWSFWGWSTFLYDIQFRRYMASKFPNFRIHLPYGDQPTVHGLHCRMVQVILCTVEDQKGCFLLVGFFCNIY